MKKKLTLLLLTLFCFSIIQFCNSIEAAPRGTYAGVDDDGYTYYIESVYPSRKGRMISSLLVILNVESPPNVNGKGRVVRCSWGYMKEMGGWVVNKDCDRNGKEIRGF